MKFAFIPSVLLVLTSAAFAQVVIPADPISGTPGAAGLLGSIYHDSANPTLVFGTNTLADYQGFESSATLQATYISLTAQTGLNYNGSDTTPVTTFLGAGDSATLNPAGYGSTMLQSTIFDLRGFINVTAADLNTPLTFNTNSDDGSFILIDGLTIVSNPGAHGPTSISGTATFSAAGLYPFQIIYGNQDFTNSTGGAMLTTAAAPGGTTFVQTPEPSALILGVFGAVGMLGRRGRRAVSGRDV